MAAELHRSDHRADRRSHRPRSRSASPSRTRRASHHRSSRRRSRSPSRSRERSRRAHRQSHRRHRSRSPPRERHKRRRRESDEKRDRHRARSRSRSRSTSKAQQKPCNETIEKASVSEDSKAEKQQQKAVINGEKKDVAVDQDAVMEDASEAPQVQESKEQAAVEKREEVQTSNPVSVESAETQEPASAVKPALDVSSIKKDILKALADARSTIAGIKKTGAAASVPTTPTPTPADVDMNKEEEQLTSPDKPQKEVVESPQKAAASPVMAPTSPKKVITSPKKVITSPKKAVTSPKEAFTSPKEAITAPIASADEFDMFSMAALDDHFDAMNGSTGVAAITVNEVSLQSNCDDAEGYYSTTIGEVLNGKYRVLGTVGKGVFSTVLRCQCLTPLKTAGDGSLDVVAIKLIRNNDIMRDAAQTELKLLNELGERDPRDKKHCIRLLDSFSHRNHAAMVFEPMQMNVREAMKKFGGKGGISIQAVRIFSKHLLIALNHLESCEVIHAGRMLTGGVLFHAPKLWKEYSDASPEGKRNFFDGAADVNEPDADADADQVENQLWKDKLADRLMNQPLYPYGWKVAKAFENGWAKVGVIEGYARVGGLLKWAVDFPGGLTLQLECMELVELLQSSIRSGLKITGGTNPWYEDM
uniref:Protein kinase domain-containing protein n=1 Tax=Phytophthora ramorum TaxID=164328 RepID=H3H2N2_PHYRM